MEQELKKGRSFGIGVHTELLLEKRHWLIADLWITSAVRIRNLRLLFVSSLTFHCRHSTSLFGYCHDSGPGATRRRPLSPTAESWLTRRIWAGHNSDGVVGQHAKRVVASFSPCKASGLWVT